MVGMSTTRAQPPGWTFEDDVPKNLRCALMRHLPDSKPAAALELQGFGPRWVYIEATHIRKVLRRLQNFEPRWVRPTSYC